MQRRRAFRVLALASLVLLAGCFGGGGGTPTATEASPTPTVPVTFAPWTSSGHLSNVTALIDAHRSQLVAEGFVSRFSTSGSTTRYVVAAERASYAIEPENGSTFAAWSNGTVAFVRQGGADDPTYSQHPAEQFSTAQLTKSSRLEHFLTSASYAVTELTDCGGTQCTVFRAEGSTRTEYQNFTAVVHVGPTGVVRQFHAEYTHVTDDGSSEVSHDFGVERLGDVSVERPSWLEEARESAS